MADLIAIGYPDETTAVSALDEAERLQQELIIQADAVAAIIRNKDGKIRTVTNHHAVGAGATWGMFWGMLFGMLFFVPFLGMAVGAGMGALMGKVTKNAVDKQFQDQVREMLQPAPRPCSWSWRRSPRTRPWRRCPSTAARCSRARCPTRPSSSSKKNCTARAPAVADRAPWGSTSACRRDGVRVGSLVPRLDVDLMLSNSAYLAPGASCRRVKPTAHLSTGASRDCEALRSHATWASVRVWPGGRRGAL
jgi:Protein of unknown function (DUF1269)